MTTSIAATGVAAVSVWPAVVAVLGTLAGALVAGLVQGRSAKAGRRETRQTTAIETVAALVAALADHRRTMWELEDWRLACAGEDVLAAARAAVHESRSALTMPWVKVKILTPSLAPLADTAVQATFVMRDAADETTLQQLRQAALDTCNNLVDAASRLFAAVGATAVAPR
jgi:hypothetical protein